jgi:hypothetical protein
MYTFRYIDARIHLSQKLVQGPAEEATSWFPAGPCITETSRLVFRDAQLDSLSDYWQSVSVKGESKITPLLN